MRCHSKLSQVRAPNPQIRAERLAVDSLRWTLVRSCPC